MEDFQNTNKEDGLQVICLGLFRCATHSLKIAMEILGYGKCYHFFEFQSRPDDEKTIGDLCDKKKVDLKSFFKGYHSTSDVPFAVFYKELYEAFPNAKYILNTRDAEKWYESSINTVYEKGDSSRKHLDKFVNYLWNDYFNGEFENKEKAIERFNQHYKEVLDYIPKEKILIYDISEGWESLCKFLGKEIPIDDFPKSNSTEKFIERYNKDKQE